MCETQESQANENEEEGAATTMTTVERAEMLLEQDAAIRARIDGGATLLGTSHRQTPVRQLVASIREGLTSFFHAPDGYEIALGNGGASAFWGIACASLVSRAAAGGGAAGGAPVVYSNKCSRIRL